MDIAVAGSRLWRNLVWYVGGYASNCGQQGRQLDCFTYKFGYPFSMSAMTQKHLAAIANYIAEKVKEYHYQLRALVEERDATFRAFSIQSGS